jgi:hypothetical protein
MLELGSKYNVLEKIVYDVRSGYNYGLFLVEDSATVLIRPDPVADFLRFKAFRNNDGKVILERFIQYMPLRISQNAAALLSFDLKNNDIAFRVIAEVWQIINCILTVNSFCFLSYFRKTH